MKRLAPSLALALLAGCAATSSIVPMGSGTYLMTKQAATGFPGLGNMKAEVLTEANAHCSKLGKEMHVMNTSETQPPYILGNYPRVEVQFTCA
jgi:hypothetical protein